MLGTVPSFLLSRDPRRLEKDAEEGKWKGWKRASMLLSFHFLLKRVFRVLLLRTPSHALCVNDFRLRHDDVAIAGNEINCVAIRFEKRRKLENILTEGTAETMLFLVLN
ncbi:hypothetical protein CEXT_395851 [Caerostris extrusa]|uniref:Uncharacterized protein n=1 Tax=Caerostris extrusa TaxID=172846 RepID=A0AAV4SKF2_CAEEX|nr:hypothetical protein CEXT_395851 [Caerostris extrusa]